MTDPTLDFLKSLDDPTKFVRGKPLPIFITHKRAKADSAGVVQNIDVSLKDLGVIAQNINERIEGSGVPVRVTPGHIKQDRNTPETEQPDIWGWAKEAKPGVFGPKQRPCIWLIPYYYPERFDESLRYPFRSPEYYHGNQEITGVALLKRDPELDMGVVTHYMRDAAELYMIGTTMPDIIPDPTVAPDVNTPAADPDFDKFLEMVKRDPVLNYLRTKFAAEAAAAPKVVDADPTQPGIQPIDTSSAPGIQPAMMQREREFTAYQKAAESRLAALEAVNANLQKEKVMLAYERDLDKLLGSGWHFDKASELKDAGEMSDKQRAAQLLRIQQNYQRDPTGGTLIPTLSGVEGTAGATKTPKTPEETAKLMRAALTKGVRDFDTAVAMYQRGELSIN
jgi:hypothetical protein